MPYNFNLFENFQQNIEQMDNKEPIEVYNMSSKELVDKVIDHIKNNCHPALYNDQKILKEIKDEIMTVSKERLIEIVSDELDQMCNYFKKKYDEEPLEKQQKNRRGVPVTPNLWARPVTGKMDDEGNLSIKTAKADDIYLNAGKSENEKGFLWEEVHQYDDVSNKWVKVNGVGLGNGDNHHNEWVWIGGRNNWLEEWDGIKPLRVTLAYKNLQGKFFEDYVYYDNNIFTEDRPEGTPTVHSGLLNNVLETVSGYCNNLANDEEMMDLAKYKLNQTSTKQLRQMDLDYGKISDFCRPFEQEIENRREEEKRREEEDMQRRREEEDMQRRREEEDMQRRREEEVYNKEEVYRKEGTAKGMIRGTYEETDYDISNIMNEKKLLFTILNRLPSRYEYQKLNVLTLIENIESTYATFIDSMEDKEERIHAKMVINFLKSFYFQNIAYYDILVPYQGNEQLHDKYTQIFTNIFGTSKIKIMINNIIDIVNSSEFVENRVHSLKKIDQLVNKYITDVFSTKELFNFILFVSSEPMFGDILLRLSDDSMEGRIIYDAGVEKPISLNDYVEKKINYINNLNLPKTYLVMLKVFINCFATLLLDSFDSENDLINNLSIIPIGISTGGNQTILQIIANSLMRMKDSTFSKLGNYNNSISELRQNEKTSKELLRLLIKGEEMITTNESTKQLLKENFRNCMIEYKKMIKRAEETGYLGASPLSTKEGFNIIDIEKLNITINDSQHPIIRYSLNMIDVLLDIGKRADKGKIENLVKDTNNLFCNNRSFVVNNLVPIMRDYGETGDKMGKGPEAARELAYHLPPEVLPLLFSRLSKEAMVPMDIFTDKELRYTFWDKSIENKLISNDFISKYEKAFEIITSDTAQDLLESIFDKGLIDEDCKSKFPEIKEEEEVEQELEQDKKIEGFRNSNSVKNTVMNILLAISFIVLLIVGYIYYQGSNSSNTLELSDTPFPDDFFIE